MHTYACTLYCIFFLKELLDTKASLYIMKNSALDPMLAHSPFKVHRQVYAECLQKRGGYYVKSSVGPEVINKIKTENALTLAPEDLLVVFNHVMTRARGALPGTPLGTYYPLNLPPTAVQTAHLHNLRISGIL